MVASLIPSVSRTLTSPSEEPRAVIRRSGESLPIQIKLATRECYDSMMDAARWAVLAQADIRLRYRRTVLGPWWATISTGAMVGSVGLVFGGLFGNEMSTYMPFFATGTIIWTFISGALVDGCGVFTNASGLIKSIPSPLTIHVFRMLARQAIILAHHVLIVVLIWALFRWPIGWGGLLALPGFALLLVALVGTSLTLGVLCTRFRDIQQIIATVLQLLFLLTPIVWMPQSLRAGHTGIVTAFNPVYHLIEVVRGPLLGHPPDARMWLSAIISATVSLVIGLLLYGKFRHRIAYWL